MIDYHNWSNSAKLDLLIELALRDRNRDLEVLSEIGQVLDLLDGRDDPAKLQALADQLTSLRPKIRSIGAVTTAPQPPKEG